MKHITLFTIVLIMLFMLTGCDSPYLPHNAYKYIPKSRPETNHTETNHFTEGDDKSMNSYFSPNSIRERYDNHINQTQPSDEDDMLYNLSKYTVKLMQNDGMSDAEIATKLREIYHFSDELIEKILADKEV